MSNRLDILQKPSVIFGSMLAGIILGMTFSDIPPFIYDFSELYILVLQMITTFMLPLAIVKSIGKLMQTESDRGFIKRVVLLFLTMMFLVSLAALIIGLVSKPVTGIDFETKKAIGRIMIQKSDESGNKGNSLFIKEIESYRPDDISENERLADFFVRIFPTNIFNALASGDSIKIVFFSIVFAIALSYSRPESSSLIIDISESLYNSFSEILRRVMYLLPFALLSIMAVQFKGITVGTIFCFSKFIIYIFLSITSVIILCMLIISKKSGHGILKQVAALKSPLIISFVSNETITAMPSAIESVVYGLGRTRDRVNLVIPLFISISVFGNIIVFTTATFFALQLYEQNTGMAGIALIISMSLITAFAAIDKPYMISVGMLSIIMGLFGLPASPAIVLLLLLGPLFDPFYCLLEVYISCAAGVILSDAQSGQSGETIVKIQK